MSLPHPWRRLRESSHITLRWFSGPGRPGYARHSTQTVYLRDDLSQAERRAVLLHELEHLAHGPAVKGYVDQDEIQTQERAARWLLPLETLADAMVWANDEHELADELWVDVATVRARLASLTDQETLALNQRLDAAERCYPATS
jgi:predicted transcriptional regulator